MGKKEKLIAAAITVALGILFIVGKSSIINVLMTILGVTLIIFGVIDIVNKLVPAGVVKIVIAVLLIVFGWVFVSAVLYLLGAGLIIVGVLILYELIKNKVVFSVKDFGVFLRYLEAIVCIAIGLLLFFNGFDWIFVLAGIVTIIEGVVICVEALKND
jgi:hypothetical protein